MRAPAASVGPWLRVADDPATVFRVPTRIGDDPDEVRYALFLYWAQMHSVSAAVRRSRLGSIRVVEGLDREALRAVSIFALGDFDEGIVFEATRCYVEFRDPTYRATDYRVVDALQWAGRRLTLRPEAVFAALLCLCDETVNSELITRRSATSCAAVRSILSRMRVQESELTRDFMSNWQDEPLVNRWTVASMR